MPNNTKTFRPKKPKPKPSALSRLRAKITKAKHDRIDRIVSGEETPKPKVKPRVRKKRITMKPKPR